MWNGSDRSDGSNGSSMGRSFRFLLVDEAWSVCSTFAILGCIRVLFSRIPGLRFVIISESGNGSAFSVPEAVVNVSCFLSHISGLSSPRRLSCRCASFCTTQDLLPARPVSTSVSCMTNLAVCRHFISSFPFRVWEFSCSCGIRELSFRSPVYSCVAWTHYAFSVQGDRQQAR